MKFSSVMLMLFFPLLFTSIGINAMWASLSDEELIESSDVIVIAELVEEKQILVNQIKKTVGVLKTEKILKGNTGQSQILLALPPRDAPIKSDDIFYKIGQKGLWFLRYLETGEETKIYLADHPQRFLSSQIKRAEIETFKRILNTMGE